MSCDFQINSGCSVKERHSVMKCYWLHKDGYAYAHLCKCMYNNLNTVDGERFAGLNINGLSAMFSRKCFCIVLAVSAHYLVQWKRGACIHGKLSWYSWKLWKMWKFSPANLSLFMVIAYNYTGLSSLKLILLF